MQHTCSVCTSTFESPRQRSNYCSNRCSAKASYEQRKDAGTYVHKRRLYERLCNRCGGAFRGIKSSLYCSRTCSVASINEPAQRRRIERLLPVLAHDMDPVDPVLRVIRGKGIWTAGKCSICSTLFVSEHRDITCSAECRDQHQLNRRRSIGHNYRARKVDAFVAKVSPRQVFEADGYRCYLCRKMTDPTKVTPHPRAPTIDHVIPLSAGGKHEPLNCRTACFICNCTKRNVGGGEQMLLIAL